MTTHLRITVGGTFVYTAKLELENAPATCGAFLELLPFANKIIHARWSGEACWIPLGDFKVGVDFENHTAYPSRGDILLYPGGLSETEILFPYGSCAFAAKVGPLAGNHFLTVVEGAEQLPEMGKRVLWGGAHDIVFEAIG